MFVLTFDKKDKLNYNFYLNGFDCFNCLMMSSITRDDATFKFLSL